MLNDTFLSTALTLSSIVLYTDFHTNALPA